MNLSVTIHNINDLTDAERAILRMIVGDKPVTLTGPNVTQQFIESLADKVVPVPPAPDHRWDHTGTPATPPAPVPASAELDSAGLPWDKRIHASSRAKVTDGTWRKMRGVSAELVASVEAELRAVQELPSVPVAPDITVAAASFSNPTAIASIPPAPFTFADLMKHVTPMLVSGKLPQDKLLSITAEVGLPHLAALGSRPDLIETVRARIDAEVRNDAAR